MDSSPYNWPIKSPLLTQLWDIAKLEHRNHPMDQSKIQGMYQQIAPVIQKLNVPNYANAEELMKYVQSMMDILQDAHARRLQEFEKMMNFKVCVLTMAMEARVSREGIPPDPQFVSRLGEKGRQCWPHLVKNHLVMFPGQTDGQESQYLPHEGLGIPGALIEKIRQELSANMAQVPEPIKAYWQQLKASRQPQQAPAPAAAAPSMMGSFKNWFSKLKPQ